MIVQRFNLNLIPNQSPVIVHVNQYDTGTGRLIATLYEGNEPYSPNGTAVIQGTKPDGHGFQYTATLDGNVVTADLTEQMAPVAGDVRTQIVVTESSGETGTFVFIMRVQPSALPSDTDMSESDYPLMEEAIREAQEAVQTAQEAVQTAQEAVERTQEAITETQENAENSEAWAQGTRGGIPVGPTDPTYEHNAEYWAHQAEGAASGVSSFNGRSGSVLPMADDYDSKKILLSSALHIGGETQSDVQEALEALEGNKADKVDNAIADNFAGLDTNGNLKDSGKNAGDFATPSDIEQIYADNGVLGAKNLLKVTANTQTLNGVTFTVNADGSVTVNGTATANINFGLISYANIDELSLWTGKHLRFSGCPSGGSNSTYALEIYYRDGREHWVRDFGDGVELNIPVSGLAYINPNIALKNGVTVNDLVFKPMLRLASDPDDTYQPYAMTNRELTEKVTVIQSGISGDLSWKELGRDLTSATIPSEAKEFIVYIYNSQYCVEITFSSNAPTKIYYAGSNTSGVCGGMITWDFNTKTLAGAQFFENGILHSPAAFMVVWR